MFNDLLIKLKIESGRQFLSISNAIQFLVFLSKEIKKKNKKENGNFHLNNALNNIFLFDMTRIHRKIYLLIEQKKKLSNIFHFYRDIPGVRWPCAKNMRSSFVSFLFFLFKKRGNFAISNLDESAALGNNKMCFV